MPTLGVVVPVYNERRTLERVIERVERAALPAGVELRIVCVDDGSTDGTAEVLDRLGETRPHLRVLCQSENRGKGAAIRAALAAVSSDIVLIQDADLEYDPSEYPRLVAPILDGRADVVYGSRFIGDRPHRVLYFWHYVGNKLLTRLSNVCTNLNLTDMECCYKVFRREVIQKSRSRRTASVSSPS